MPRKDSPVVAVVGSVNVDLIAYALRVPGPGETVIGDRFSVGFGGKGANQAVMARRLGAEVWLVARIGKDAYGEAALADLDAEGVQTRHVRRVSEPTGVAPIWVEPDGTNRIVVIPGANARWDPVDAAASIEAIAGLDVVVGQLEIPQAATAAAFRAAKQRGARTILNPAPAQPIEPSLLEATDWLIPNEGELVTLASLLGAAGSAAATTGERGRAVAARTGTRLVVTLGAAGAILVLHDGRLVDVPVPPDAAPEVVDTTGAGDAFVGAFAVGLAEALTRSMRSAAPSASHRRA